MDETDPYGKGAHARIEPLLKSVMNFLFWLKA